MKTRSEHDFLGEKEIPVEALYGIHTARALENFDIAGRRVNPRLVHAYGAVKLAAATSNHDLGCLDEKVYAALEAACHEMIDGKLDQHILVDALQGGAGTSTNMNVNEVLANRALQIYGAQPGDYAAIDPLEHVNMHQSTNDTYPTALKVAAIGGIRDLERELGRLVEAFQSKEKEFYSIVKVGRTQIQDAVLTTMGRSMAAFAEAFGRDRWRIYKCEERLGVINLGGTAIGTGLGAPGKYIFKATDNLKAITGYGLARAENMIECTQNADVYAEVSGILNACAVNFLKITGDLRLMASGPHAGLGELKLPALQEGSSIMPGKVNPVIPEAAAQAALQVTGNSLVITQACAMGNLELNAFLPIIADRLLDSIDILSRAATAMTDLCVSGLIARKDSCALHVDSTTAVLTALIDELGHEEAGRIASKVEAEMKTVREIILEEGLMTAERFDELIAPEALTALGGRN